MTKVKEFSVYSPKGGVGKSTIAVNLAGYFSEVENKRVAVVDLDEQHSLLDIYGMTLCKFDVLAEPPKGESGKHYDVVIYDHHPKHQHIDLLGEKVICPIRPSRLDFTSYKRGRNYIGSIPHVLVVNQWSARVADDLDFIKQVRGMAKDHNIDFAAIKARNVFKTMTNSGQTVFNAGSKFNGPESRNEIALLAGLL